MGIKQRFKAMNPNLGSHCIASRDILYLHNKENSKEEYIYPLANISSITYSYAFNELTTTERVEADLAPSEMLIVLETIRGDKQLFACKLFEMSFDYYGFDNEE
jgi:hypothetical protein